MKKIVDKLGVYQTAFDEPGPDPCPGLHLFLATDAQTRQCHLWEGSESQKDEVTEEAGTCRLDNGSCDEHVCKQVNCPDQLQKCLDVPKVLSVVRGCCPENL